MNIYIYTFTVISLQNLIIITMVESSKKNVDFNVSDIVWSMAEHVMKTDQEYLSHIP